MHSLGVVVITDRISLKSYPLPKRAGLGSIRWLHWIWQSSLARRNWERSARNTNRGTTSIAAPSQCQFGDRVRTRISVDPLKSAHRGCPPGQQAVVLTLARRHTAPWAYQNVSGDHTRDCPLTFASTHDALSQTKSGARRAPVGYLCRRNAYNTALRTSI